MLTTGDLALLEEFICYLYGHKCKEINTVRYNKFKDTYEKKNKILDLSLLPACQQTLRLHFKRSNYVASIWKNCLVPRVDLPAVESHGWTQSGEIIWCENVLPENIEDILIDQDSDSEGEIENESESETDEDEDA